jgi:hypothetical protein
MKRGVFLTLFFAIAMLTLSTACEKGRYTDDGHYVGNPERIPTASEPAKDGGARQPSGTERR